MRWAGQAWPFLFMDEETELRWEVSKVKEAHHSFWWSQQPISAAEDLSLSHHLWHLKTSRAVFYCSYFKNLFPQVNYECTEALRAGIKRTHLFLPKAPGRVQGGQTFIEYLLHARPLRTQPSIPHDNLWSGNSDHSCFTEETGSEVKELLWGYIVSKLSSINEWMRRLDPQMQLWKETT